MFKDEFDLVGFKSDVHGVPADLTKKQRRRQRRSLRHKRFAAGLAVDLANTCDWPTSLISLSGTDTSLGRIVDLAHANTNTGVWVVGASVSGPLPVLIQTSDGITSGSFTDPTSGLSQMPFGFSSGGVFWANSGLYASGNRSPSSPLADGALMCSGGIQFAHFQRPHRYARLLLTSGNASIANGLFFGGFIANKRTTGSGGGFTFAPGSGSVSV